MTGPCESNVQISPCWELSRRGEPLRTPYLLSERRDSSVATLLSRQAGAQAIARPAPESPDDTAQGWRRDDAMDEQVSGEMRGGRRDGGQFSVLLL